MQFTFTKSLIFATVVSLLGAAVSASAVSLAERKQQCGEAGDSCSDNADPCCEGLICNVPRPGGPGVSFSICSSLYIWKIFDVLTLDLRSHWSLRGLTVERNRLTMSRLKE